MLGGHAAASGMNTRCTCVAHQLLTTCELPVCDPRRSSRPVAISLPFRPGSASRRIGMGEGVMRAWKGLAAASAATCLLAEPLWAATDVILADEDPNSSGWSAQLLSNDSGVLLPEPTLA